MVILNFIETVFKDSLKAEYTEFNSLFAVELIEPIKEEVWGC